MHVVSRALESSRGSPESLLAAIIDSSDDAIVSKDLTGTITSWNRGAEAIFGYTSEEVVGKSISILFPPDRLDEEPHILERLKRGERVDHFQTKRVRKDGTVLDISVTISPVKDANGKIVGASKIARNITEQKRVERLAEEAKQKLEEANERLKEVDRLKSEFLAAMSHELRTPLNSIIGFTGILRQQIPGPLNEEQIKQLTMVSTSAKHLLHLINDILDLSRIEAGRTELHLEEVDVEQVIDEAIKTQGPAAIAKGLTLTKQVAELPRLWTDRKRLLQILLNLLSNGVKFTNEGEIRVEASRQNGWVSIVVSDTGIGIKAENLKLLFEAFRQLEGSARRRYEGTGLGLHLSRKLAGLLGGRIEAESEFGKGSRFTLRLPVERRVTL